MGEGQQVLQLMLMVQWGREWRRCRCQQLAATEQAEQERYQQRGC